MFFGYDVLTTVGGWFLEHGIRIVGIVVLFLILNRFGHTIAEKIIRNIMRSQRFITPAAERKREDTLIRVFDTFFSVFLTVTAIIMILAELGIDTGAMIAGLGVVGVAVGFGAQYMVKDFISGFFILLENQYRVGDVVSFGDTSGVVEDISLRMTILRDLDGTVHHVPNGEIKIASNLSKYHANVNLDVGVAYNSDLEKVINIINKVGSDLAEDEDWKGAIRKAPQVLRVDDFADSAIILKITGETEALKQWDVTGELRKRIKFAFDKHHIEIPFPQRVVHMAK